MNRIIKKRRRYSSSVRPRFVASAVSSSSAFLKCWIARVPGDGGSSSGPSAAFGLAGWDKVRGECSPNDWFLLLVVRGRRRRRRSLGGAAALLFAAAAHKTALTPTEQGVGTRPKFVAAPNTALRPDPDGSITLAVIYKHYRPSSAIHRSQTTQIPLARHANPTLSISHNTHTHTHAHQITMHTHTTHPSHLYLHITSCPSWAPGSFGCGSGSCCGAAARRQTAGIGSATPR